MISQVGLIALLLNDSGIVRGDSSQTAINQPMMQFSQSGHRDSRLTKLHAHADCWIQHPCGDHRDQARAIVHVDNTSWAASFDISIANLPTVKWMPPIVNL
jgi:hypothetical protein